MMKKAALLLILVLVIGAFFAATNRPSPANASQAATLEATAQTAGQVHGNAVESWQDIYIAQQNFQHGYMFWLSSTKTIWVLIRPNNTSNSGEWRVYPDTFQDGEAETDPSLSAPSAKQYQPRRGFGKIWRDQSTGLMTALGWGTTPEFAVTTPLGYLHTDKVSRYLLLTLGREIFTLTETTPGTPGGTWEIVGLLREGNAFAATQIPSTATVEATMEGAMSSTDAPTAAATK